MSDDLYVCDDADKLNWSDLGSGWLEQIHHLARQHFQCLTHPCLHQSHSRDLDTIQHRDDKVGASVHYNAELFLVVCHHWVHSVCQQWKRPIFFHNQRISLHGLHPLHRLQLSRCPDTLLRRVQIEHAILLGFFAYWYLFTKQFASSSSLYEL